MMSASLSINPRVCVCLCGILLAVCVKCVLLRVNQVGNHLRACLCNVWDVKLCFYARTVPCAQSRDGVISEPSRRSVKSINSILSHPALDTQHLRCL